MQSVKRSSSQFLRCIDIFFFDVCAETLKVKFASGVCSVYVRYRHSTGGIITTFSKLALRVATRLRYGTHNGVLNE
jgi:hypothetical protein